VRVSAGAASVLAWIPILALTAVAGYSTVIALVGFTHRVCKTDSPALRYLSEASMRIYILDQAAITVPGFYIVRSDLWFAQKYFAVLAVAFAVTFAVYHFFVRPNPYLRPLFGMSPQAFDQQIRPWAIAAGATAALLVVALGVSATSARATAPAIADGLDPAGLWFANNSAAKIKIRHCGRKLCGRIVELKHP
jgi:hypothetical protein